MALVKNYEVHGSGYEIPNAYHVISDVQVIKRTRELPVSPDSDDPLKGGIGYIGMIFIEVYANKDARLNKLNPVGYINSAMPEMNIKLKFEYDPTSSDDILTQAYNYLKTTDYYNTAEED